MIHLLQAEYDELVAAKEALALLRGERVAAAVPCESRALVLLELAGQLRDQAKAMGMHLTIERTMMPGAPLSQANLGYVTKAWPDQRAR